MIKVVTIEIEIDETVGTEEEMDAFIEYEFGYTGGIDSINSYLDEGLEVIRLTID